MIEIIPSILVESKEEFERRLRLVDPLVKTVHIDILDGTLFPHVSWHDPQVVGDIETAVDYEIHLMVENPLPIIDAWKGHVKNLKRAIIHAELDRPREAILERIRQWHKLEGGVALNPETPYEEIRRLINSLDLILVMGVHPGRSGQSFEGEYILNKIREIHKAAAHLPLSCDGGVTTLNTADLIQAGCSRLVVASAIWQAPDPAAAIAHFQNLGNS